MGLLWTTASLAVPVTGLTAICLYNLVYTPLKRKTTIAVIPGAVCGVLPVLMGWAAAGGELGSPKLWLLMVVFSVWQLPHFWLIVLANQEDYRESNIPNMLRVLSVRQLQNLVFLWVTAFAVLTLLLPLYRVILSETAAWILLVNALILASFFGAILFSSQREDGGYHGLFRYLNLSVAVVMSVIIVDGMSRSWQ
jgi:protoheme IX farnesyltransferase